MAIVRFLDKNNQCYQVQAPENPVLIYLTPNERKQIMESPVGQCLMLIDGQLPQNIVDEKIAALNIKEQPKTLE